MELFPKLDEQQTIDNAKYYFEHEFPRVKARSHMDITSIQSPRFDTVGTSGTTVNTQENKVMSQLIAQDLVKATYKTIDNIPNEKYRLILSYHYLYDKSNSHTMELAHYEKTRYNECKNNALLYFAESFVDHYVLQVYIESKSCQLRC